MRKRYGKFLLALVLALTLLMAGCGSQTPDTPVTPVNPGTEQTDPQDKPETPDTPDTPDEPDTPDTSEPSGQDQYHTDPVPQGKPQPVEPEETKPDTSQQATCTISISCATILNNMDKCEEAKRALIPADGTILAASTVTFSPGESVFDVLQRVCRERKIPMEFSFTPIYNSAYIEGIYNLYEFDVGDGSGWMYKVNDWFPNYGCSRYQVQQHQVPGLRVQLIGFVQPGPPGHIHLAPDDRVDALGLAGPVKVDGAVHNAMVRDGHRRLAQLLHQLRQVPDAAGTVQQTVLRVDVQMGKGHITPPPAYR